MKKSYLKLKQLLLFIVFFNVFVLFSVGQVAINTDGSTPDANAMLDVSATNKGILIPRITQANRPAAPTAGLVIYQTDNTPGFYYYDGSNWVRFSAGGDDWTTIGNGGTAAGTNFLGTTDAVDLVIRTNNTEKLRIETGGDVGIGITNPTQKLHVDGNSLVTGNMYVNSSSNASIHYGNTGFYGSAVGWHPDPNSDNGIWLEGSNGESGGFFANGDCAVIWSPGDNDIFRIYDEDDFSSPKFVIDGQGEVGIGTSTPTNLLHLYTESTLKDGFEDNTISPFSTSGDANWATTSSVLNSGSYAAASGAISDDEHSDLQITKTIPTGGRNITFAYKVSSEADYDFLNFYVDGTLKDQWSGDIDWTTVSFFITAGSHTFKWEYKKDGSDNSGDDKAYIDDVLIAGKYVFRLQDGSEAKNMVLASNSDGTAGWQDVDDLSGIWTRRDNLVFTKNYTTDSVLIGSNTGPSYNFAFAVYNGSASGTNIGIGSVEYFTDALSETTINNAFSPATDNSYGLGSSSLRWTDVWAVDGTINTSDRRDKKNIRALNYGLTELMQLQPVTFEWIADRPDVTTKIGFIAQDLYKVIPEAVKTKELVCVSEEPLTFEVQEVERMGIFYSDLIPVLVKSIQDQQKIIDAQNDKNLELEKRIVELEKVIYGDDNQ